jgi:hypothetical protein
MGGLTLSYRQLDPWCLSDRGWRGIGRWQGPEQMRDAADLCWIARDLVKSACLASRWSGTHPRLRRKRAAGETAIFRRPWPQHEARIEKCT